MVGQDLGARLIWIPSGTLQTTFPAAGSCLSRDILEYPVAGNSKTASLLKEIRSLSKETIFEFSEQRDCFRISCHLIG